MKKLRLFITHILLVVMLVSIMPVSAFAAEETVEVEIEIPIGDDYMYIDGEAVELSSPAYIDNNGYAVFPLLDIAKTFVNPKNFLFDNSTKTHTILYGQRIITFSEGSNHVVINGSAITLNPPLVWDNDIIFIGLRDFSTLFGITDFAWDTATYTAYLTADKFLPKHYHDWADEWNYNDTHHWHECTETEPPCTITDNEDKDDYDSHYFNKISITASPASLITYTCNCGKNTEAEYENTIIENGWETSIYIPIGQNFIYADGEVIELSAPAYVDNNGYAMFPLQDVAIAMGVNPNNILFDNSTKTYTILWGQRIITISKGSNSAYINGTRITLHPSPVWDDYTTFLSMEDTVRILGMTGYLWNGITETATLYNGSHIHTWGTWNNNDTYHWKECPICLTTDNSSKGSHSTTAIITPPTCTEKGYTTHSCICGYSYKDNYTAPTGHSFADGICISCQKQGGECSAATWINDPANTSVTVTAKESICAIAASYRNGKIVDLDMIYLDGGDADTLALKTIGENTKLFILYPDHMPVCQSIGL